jgi:hypothetical protein
MAPQHYTATAKQNPGRKGWLVEYRNPLSNDRPGKKTRKGLGTDDRDRAQLLASQLSELLANDSLWSLGARAEAAKLYEPEVIEIFYSEMEPRTSDARPLRDKLLDLPSREEGYAKVALLGVPGAGKTTLVRQFIGTHPKTEAFPSTSMNRTTTFPTELVLQGGDYHAVVTFMSEYETRFEVEECVSTAIIDAVDGIESVVARTFLEKSDMRFRLKYLLGDLDDQDDEADPYADESDRDLLADTEDDTVIHDDDRKKNAATVRSFVERIIAIAADCRAIIEEKHGALAEMVPMDRAAALDLIEKEADASEVFLVLISDIMDELRTKFECVGAVGKYEKTTTKWPRAWVAKAIPEERSTFIKSLRYFSGIGDKSWGRLLTPLVNGMRVKGPFRPGWSSEQPRLILMDTEGLGHKANSTADLPEQTAALLREADAILLVDNAKNGLTNYAAGKALESIANTGATRKLSMVFTHMDMASASGLKGQRLHDQIFSGLRNVVDNQLSKSLTGDSARYLIERLQDHTFYVGRLNQADAKGAEPELNRLLTHLMKAQPAVVVPVSIPQYNSAFLLMAIQEAARDFRRQWRGILGIAPDATYKPKSWQTIKALSRRYAENWGESFELRPAANLRTALENATARFLEGPIAWSGNPTAEQKREAIEWLKEEITKELPDLARRRLRENPQLAWHDAWTPRGSGSTITRRIRIEGIYERWVPIPDARGDKEVVEFMQEIQSVMDSALKKFKNQVEGRQLV